MHVQAYAKINLGLHILGKRSDGYHDLATVFHRIDLFDTLEFREAASLSLRCNDPAIPADGTNLVLKAAERLREATSAASGAEITLTKQIPVGAGLGGGSSDAASTLLALSTLWNAKLSNQKLMDIAARLGSDVPYFLTEGPAYATGRGEVLEPLNLTLPFWIVVVFPHIHVSTAWAYSRLRLVPREQPDLKAYLLEHAADPRCWHGFVRNDFEQVVFDEFPSIRQAIVTLNRSGACFAQLSGSGSAVYGLFESQPDIDLLKASFPADHRLYVTPPNFRPANFLSE